MLILIVRKGEFPSSDPFARRILVGEPRRVTYVTKAARRVVEFTGGLIALSNAETLVVRWILLTAGFRTGTGDALNIQPIRVRIHVIATR